jgi:hypothetical protein
MIRTSQKMLNFVFRKLEQDHQIRPIRIIGIRMDTTFAAKIFAVMVSGIFAMINVYTRS